MGYLIRIFYVALLLICIMSNKVSAQTAKKPLRIGVVGLVHSHVGSTIWRRSCGVKLNPSMICHRCK